MSVEPGLTIPLQRHLKIRALPYGQEPDRRFCRGLHGISLRGRPSPLAVHCHTQYTFVLYDLSRPEWARPPRGVRFVTCTFGEWKDGRVLEKGTQCKMARGQMVRWLAEHKIEDPENLRAFDQIGYCFHEELSTENHHVFLKQPEHAV